MIVGTTLKLTQKDWIKEQTDDVDLNKSNTIIKVLLVEHIYDPRDGFASNPNLVEM